MKFLHSDKLFKEMRHLILYCCIGVCGAGLDFLIYCFLTYCDIYYLVANVAGVISGITLNFFLNAYFNFRVSSRKFARFLRFFSIGLFGLLVSSVCLYIFIETFSLNSLVAKALTIFIVTAIQFTLNRLITFKGCSHNPQA